MQLQLIKHIGCWIYWLEPLHNHVQWGHKQMRNWRQSGMRWSETSNNCNHQHHCCNHVIRGLHTLSHHFLTAHLGGEAHSWSHFTFRGPEAQGDEAPCPGHTASNRQKRIQTQFAQPQSSVQFSCSVMSDSWWPHGLQHARLPCPSPTTGACSNSCSWSWWCHTAFSVRPLFLLPLLFPGMRVFSSESGLHNRCPNYWSFSFSISLPMNIQDRFPLGFTGLIFLQSKRLSRVFSNTTVQKHQFFGAQLSLWSNSHLHTWLVEKP